MAVTFNKSAPIVVRLPKTPEKPQVTKAPDNETQGHILENNNTSVGLTTHETITADNLFDELDSDEATEYLDDVPMCVGVTVRESITCTTNYSELADSPANKKGGTGIAKGKKIPPARAVTYGGETYPSLTKCLKELGLCRDRFKYLKRTRKELKSDNLIIGLMVHERRQEAMQGTSYVIAIKGDVCFERNLTAACTRVNQMLKLPPKEAMTQSQVSKYRYEHNRRPCNADRQITLYEAFTSCLARLLVRQQLLDDADRAMFKARMQTVGAGVNNEQDLFDIVDDDDDSHLEALKDLADQYKEL